MNENLDLPPEAPDWTAPPPPPAPPPVFELAPVPPGPGLPMALVWILAFFLGQFAILFAIIFVVVALKVGEHGKDGVQMSLETIQEPFFLLITGSGAILVTVLGLTLLAFGKNLRTKLALRLPSLTHTVLVFLIAPPLYIVVIQIALWVQPMVPKLGLLEGLEEMIKGAPWLLVLITGALCPGISEELFSRGLLGRGLVARWGPGIGTLFAAVFFGLIHIEPLQVCYAIYIGAVLQYVYLNSKSLLAAMLLHALNNTIAFLPGKKPEWFPGVQEVLTNWELNVGGVPIQVLLSAEFAVVTLLLLFQQTRVRWFRGDGQPWDPGYVTAEMPPARVNPTAHSNRPTWWGVTLALAAYVLFVLVLLQEFGVMPKIIGF